MDHHKIQRARAGWYVLGFVFWAAFLLVLEPGNLSRASALGRELTLGREAARICCAALIGVGAMPAVLAMESRYAMRRGSIICDLFWLLLGLAALAGAMNVVSSFVAAWGFERVALPDVDSIRRQLVANWLLLAFVLIGLTAIIRLVRSALPVEEKAALREVIVRSGTRTLRVDLASVDWVQAQGNYVALHVGERTYLLRTTLARFMREIDTERFIRIHRSAVVAVDRIAALRSEADGEASAQLVTGQVLKVSKSCRKAVRARWGAPQRGAQQGPEMKVTRVSR